MKQHIFRTIEKPYLLALVVGTLINGLAFFSALLLLGWTEVTHKMSQQWQMSAALVVIQTAIPFIIPYLVTLFAKELSQQKIQEILKQFPDANPNIVMRLNTNLTPDYINPVGQAWLEKHHLDTQQLNVLLPKEIADKLQHKKNLGETTLEAEKNYGTEIYHFNAKVTTTGSIFITAEDVTENRKLNHSQQHTLLQLNQLTSLLKDNLSQYNPNHFNLFQMLHNMLAQIACYSDDSIDIPSAIFCTFSENDQAVSGQLFKIENKQARPLTEVFSLEPTGYAYAISKGTTDIFYEYWQPEKQTLQDFQQQFNPIVRQHLGAITGYTTYQSGPVSIIGFFQTNHPQFQFNDILKQIALFAHFFHRISQESMAIYEQFTYTLEALARASEANDEDTGQHIVRINEYAYVMAKALNQSQAFCDEIRLTAMMHDVGKIHLDPAILKKPGALTHEERLEMMQHPIYGAKILGESEKMKMAAEIALYHHEKYDGSGYPTGLKGEEIPLAARIVSLVDVYDALRQKRVYKPAFDHQKTVQILTEGDGRTRVEEFDPQILAAFKRIHLEFDAIFTRMNE